MGPSEILQASTIHQIETAMYWAPSILSVETAMLDLPYLIINSILIPYVFRTLAQISNRAMQSSVCSTANSYR